MLVLLLVLLLMPIVHAFDLGDRRRRCASAMPLLFLIPHRLLFISHTLITIQSTLLVELYSNLLSAHADELCFDRCSAVLLALSWIFRSHLSPTSRSRSCRRPGSLTLTAQAVPSHLATFIALHVLSASPRPRSSGRTRGPSAPRARFVLAVCPLRSLLRVLPVCAACCAVCRRPLFPSHRCLARRLLLAFVRCIPSHALHSSSSIHRAPR